MAHGFLVLTAVGPDRVGIVDDLSGAVSRGGCNIEESKMAVLGGEFAVIMLVSGSETSIEALGASLLKLGDSLGLRVSSQRTREPKPAERGRPYLLTAVSLDTPGIVHSITALLRRYGVNIEDMETETALAPWTGAPMFRLTAHLVIGSTVSVNDLKKELAHLQQQQDLDVALKPVFAGPESGEPR